MTGPPSTSTEQGSSMEEEAERLHFQKVGLTLKWPSKEAKEPFIVQQHKTHDIDHSYFVFLITGTLEQFCKSH